MLCNIAHDHSHSLSLSLSFLSVEQMTFIRRWHRLTYCSDETMICAPQNLEGLWQWHDVYILHVSLPPLSLSPSLSLSPKPFWITYSVGAVKHTEAICLLCVRSVLMGGMQRMQNSGQNKDNRVENIWNTGLIECKVWLINAHDLSPKTHTHTHTHTYMLLLVHTYRHTHTHTRIYTHTLEHTKYSKYFTYPPL